jgi:hypothetical protein
MSGQVVLDSIGHVQRPLDRQHPPYKGVSSPGVQPETCNHYGKVSGRMADEIDAGQERGEIATGRPKSLARYLPFKAALQVPAWGGCSASTTRRSLPMKIGRRNRRCDHGVTMPATSGVWAW